MSIEVIAGDCLKLLPTVDRPINTIFVDPPDAIDLGYDQPDIDPGEYPTFLHRLVSLCCDMSNAAWFSFNSRHTLLMAQIAADVLALKEHELKICVQTFNFGQYRSNDLGNNHRPLWRFLKKGTRLYPDAIKVPSVRQQMGDKRAKSGGRVPGDVFEFCRVQGNNKQRRKWHPTQLNEGLIERCLKLTTPPNGFVVDPCVGTGTTLRVAQRLNLDAIGIDRSDFYCEQIKKEMNL